MVAPTKQRGPGYGLAGVLRTRRPRAKDSRGTGDSLLFLRDREHAKLVKRAQEVRQRRRAAVRADAVGGNRQLGVGAARVRAQSHRRGEALDGARVRGAACVVVVGGGATARPGCRVQRRGGAEQRVAATLA